MVLRQIDSKGIIEIDFKRSSARRLDLNGISSQINQENLKDYVQLK